MKFETVQNVVLKSAFYALIVTLGIVLVTTIIVICMERRLDPREKVDLIKSMVMERDFFILLTKSYLKNFVILIAMFILLDVIE